MRHFHNHSEQSFVIGSKNSTHRHEYNSIEAYRADTKARSASGTRGSNQAGHLSKIFSYFFRFIFDLFFVQNHVIIFPFMTKTPKLKSLIKTQTKAICSVDQSQIACRWAHALRSFPLVKPGSPVAMATTRWRPAEWRREKKEEYAHAHSFTMANFLTWQKEKCHVSNHRQLML